MLKLHAWYVVLVGLWSCVLWGCWSLELVVSGVKGSLELLVSGIGLLSYALLCVLLAFGGDVWLCVFGKVLCCSVVLGWLN